MKQVLLIAAAGTVLFGIANAQADQKVTLRIGDPAPPLEFERFVKGDPITSVDPKRIYVLDFWGTWCGPCCRDIPHISWLQSKYPDVVFIGVEEGDSPEDLAKFMQAKGGKINYRIAVDKGAEHMGAMSKSWMAAAGDNSFPSVMVVAKGRLAWLGKPGYSEEHLEKIFSGPWDFEAAAKEYAQGPISMQDAEAGEVGKLFDKAVTDGNSDEFNAALQRAWKGFGKYYEIVGYGFDQVTKPGCKVTSPDYKLGEKLLEFKISRDQPSSPWILGVYGLVCARAGDKDKAQAALQQAIAQADGDDKERLSRELGAIKD